MKKRKPIKIETQIMILVVVLLSLSILVSAAIARSWFDRLFQQKVEDNITNIASFVAADDDIQDALSNRDPDGIIQPIVKNYLESVEDITFIVVTDMDSIRYSHPVPERVGEKFVGGDEKRIIETGESYISESIGTLGRSLRAFEPIFHEGSQVGFVAVGTLMESLNAARQDTYNTLIIWVVFSLAIGSIGSFLIANSIKRSLLGLEPEQIVKLFTEQSSMLDAIHEGIISIDETGNITLINESAFKILGIHEMDSDKAMGRYVEEVFPTSRLTHIIRTGKSEFDKEQIINGRVIVTNRVPIMNENRILGAIATFRDKTDLMNLAEELTGVNQIVQALRANSHEFLNKIHVIMGLLQIKEYEEAERYLRGVIHRQKNISSHIIKNVRDSIIAGLILGKISRANELGVVLVLDKRTKMYERHGRIDSAVLIKIVGNLVENALSAVLDNTGSKKINLFIFEDQETLYIEVEDNGHGILPENLPDIFNRGYTTKEGSDGTGLFLVKSVIDELAGDIKVESVRDEGTLFQVTLRKEIQNDQSVDC